VSKLSRQTTAAIIGGSVFLVASALLTPGWGLGGSRQELEATSTLNAIFASRAVIGCIRGAAATVALFLAMSVAVRAANGEWLYRAGGAEAAAKDGRDIEVNTANANAALEASQQMIERLVEGLAETTQRVTELEAVTQSTTSASTSDATSTESGHGRSR
jgi:hypothetical protein